MLLLIIFDSTLFVGDGTTASPAPLEKEEQLRRVRDVYMDGDLPKEEYTQRRRTLEERLHGLVVPGVDAANEAGKLLENLPQLWEEATARERRNILLTMLDAVYADTREEKAVVAIRPKPAFQALFALATTQEGSGVIMHQPDQLRITQNGQASVQSGDGGESNSSVNTLLTFSLLSHDVSVLAS